MPNLEVTNQTRVKPAVDRKTLRPQGALQMEVQAERQSGAQFAQLAGTVGDLAQKLHIADANSQIDAGVLDNETFLDSAATRRRKDPNLAEHRSSFETEYDQWSSERLSAVKNPAAKEKLTSYYARQKLSQGTKIETDAYTRLAREERANLPFTIQQSVEAELDATVPNAEELARKEWEETLARLRASGQITEAGEKERRRLRAMMLMETAAKRWPEATLEGLQNKETLGAIISDKEAALLSSEDMISLERRANQELSMQNSEKRAQQSQAAAELEAAQADKGNEAYAKHLANKDAEAAKIINESPFDSDWKISQLAKLDQAARIREKDPAADPFTEDGSKELVADLWTKFYAGTLTQPELEKWQGDKDGISTPTYKALSDKLAQSKKNPEEVQSLGVKQRFDDLKSMRGADTDAKIEALDAVGLVKINSEQYHAGTEALSGAIARDPEVATDPEKLQAAWTEEVMPAMLGARNPDTGKNWWDKLWETTFDFNRSPIPAIRIRNEAKAKGEAERIRVRKPDGSVGTVSKKSLPEAKKAGYTVIE